jgi:hypothetical protein
VRDVDVRHRDAADGDRRRPAVLAEFEAPGGLRDPGPRAQRAAREPAAEQVVAGRVRDQEAREPRAFGRVEPTLGLGEPGVRSGGGAQPVDADLGVFHGARVRRARW